MSESLSMEFEGVEPANEFGFDPIEPGVYEARVDKTEFKFAQSGDKSPMSVVDWKIESGQYKGRTVRFHNIVFSPKMARVIKGVLISLGLKVPTRPVSAEALAKAFTRDAVGKLARITVVNGEPNKEGKVYPEVRAVYPAEIQGVGPSATSDNGGEDLPTL